MFVSVIKSEKRYFELWRFLLLFLTPSWRFSLSPLLHSVPYCTVERVNYRWLQLTSFNWSGLLDKNNFWWDGCSNGTHNQYTLYIYIYTYITYKSQISVSTPTVYLLLHIEKIDRYIVSINHQCVFSFPFEKMQLSMSMRCTYFLFNTFRHPSGRTSHRLHLERAPALNFCSCYFSTPRRPPTGSAAADSRRTANASISYCKSRSCSHNTFIVALFSTSKSSFVPPDPPSFTGEAVFPNIDLNSYSSDASLRNQDKNGVFVVTGASRGIGLEIVKDLTDRTKVRKMTRMSISRNCCTF